MRVTTKMLTSTLLNNVNNNYGKLQEYENQLSSGVRVNKPSDDPIAAAQLIDAKSALNSQKQYDSNMEMANRWLLTVDGALANANDVLLRARGITVAGSTGTTTQDSMKALADEVDGLVAEMVGVANTDYAGRYIFGGGKTGSPPFKILGDSNPVTEVQFISSSYDASLLDETYSQKVEIAAGVTMDISAGRITFHTGADGSDDVNSILETLIKLRTGLQNGDQKAVGAILSDIDAQTDNVISERAVVGAKCNRIELAQNRAAAYSESLNTLIRDLGDADYAEASALYSTQQAVFNAALSVAAKIIQPSLLDFLR